MWASKELLRLAAIVMVAAPIAHAQQPADPLAALVQRAAPNSDGTRVAFAVLPPALADAIQKKVPGFRMRRSTELSYQAMDELSLAALQVKSNLLVAADLDGDKRNEAVLWGVVESASAPRVADGDDVEQTGVVLGIRRLGDAYEVTELVRHAETLHVSYEGSPPKTDLVLTMVQAGKARNAVTWVLLQDGDCKLYGVQWTLRAGKWVSAKSKCSYGD